MASFLTRPLAEKDAVLVQSLRDLGAIPFCHTNLPQTTYSISSANPIFGTTTHPMDKDRTPGGSSSGEGALGALHGSAFGIGSDIGGSIRIPAHWCGIFGIKVVNKKYLSAQLTPLLISANKW